MFLRLSAVIRILRGEDWLMTRDTVCGASAPIVLIRIILDPRHFSLWKQQLAFGGVGTSAFGCP